MPLRRILTAASFALFLGGVAAYPVWAADTPPLGPDAADPDAAPRAKILDDLFGKLAGASDEGEAHAVAAAIERVWMRSGSDTADLLMSRASQAMSQKNYALSERILDQLVSLEPHWAQAWNVRATERYLADDETGSVEDIGRALTLEPRHFGAIAGLGFLLRRAGDDKGALRAFRRALEINPQQPELRKLVDGLALDVEGRGI